MTPATRPTIQDFVVGSPYSVTVVAAFFSVSDQTIRRWIQSGRLKAVRLNPFQERTPEPRAMYMIDGGEVKRAYGSALLDQDRRSAPVPRLGDVRKRVAKRLKELELLGARK